MEVKFFLSDVNRIHFIGIGGASMSGLAKFCLTQGKIVSGSDKVLTVETRRLASLGAKIFKGHKALNAASADLVVYSSAVDDSNPELFYAYRHGIPVIKRSQMLGEILSEFKKSIAVSGSHGKTTVTAMIAEIFIVAGLNPTVFLGGERKTFGNFRLGEKDYAVAEACEYKRNFLDIHPSVAVILNVDNDHVDTYKSIEESISAFSLFSKNSFCVINADDDNASRIFNPCSVTFGIEKFASYSAKYVTKTPCRAFTVYAYGKRLGRVNLKIAGRHNVYNALAAIAVATECGIPFGKIQTALNAFDGVKRRNEYLGELFGVKCFADYAHHPTEIRALLTERSERTLAVFQPHTYSRTAALMQDFISALTLADGVVIYKTYPAREKFAIEGDAKTLFDALKKRKAGDVFYAGSRSELKKKVNEIIKDYDKVLFIGAGDIYSVALRLIQN